MKVLLHNPNSGELKAVKVGWSWTLFFFSGFFGLPLFLRKLYYWGLFFLILPLMFSFAPEMPEDKAEQAVIVLTYLFSVLIQFGLYVFMAIKGNELTAKNLLEKGWKFAHPEAVETQFAKHKWRLM
ncbi:MAG: hypothetical protein AB1698_10580 [Pseudomonadota bacterium]